VLTSVPVPQTSDYRVFTGQNGNHSPEVSPVNLVTYANRIQKSGIDILYCPSDSASYSAYSQNSDSPSKSNCPIDLVVSAPRIQSERSELLNANDPVDLAAYTHKRPDYTAQSNHAVNEISAVSVRSNSEGSRPLSSVQNNAVQTVSTDILGQGTVCTTAQPGTYQNAPDVIHSIAAASSARPLQTGAYPQNVGLTHNMPSSYHSAQWQPVLSPRTAQLMATAVCNTSGQPLCSDNAVKEGEQSPLLLQLQVFFRLCLKYLLYFLTYMIIYTLTRTSEMAVMMVMMVVSKSDKKLFYH